MAFPISAHVTTRSESQSQLVADAVRAQTQVVTVGPHQYRGFYQGRLVDTIVFDSRGFAEHTLSDGRRFTDIHTGSGGWNLRGGESGGMHRMMIRCSDCAALQATVNSDELAYDAAFIGMIIVVGGNIAIDVATLGAAFAASFLGVAAVITFVGTANTLATDQARLAIAESQ